MHQSKIEYAHTIILYSSFLNASIWIWALWKHNFGQFEDDQDLLFLTLQEAAAPSYKNEADSLDLTKIVNIHFSMQIMAGNVILIVVRSTS